jgi:MFS family permease
MHVKRRRTTLPELSVGIVDTAASTRRRAIIAGNAGNVMEWYDFAAYGYFATVIGSQFFPSKDPTSSLIAAFGVFAAGFLMRPVGSLVLGYIGDKLGRKLALTTSVMVMAAPTFLVGLFAAGRFYRRVHGARHQHDRLAGAGGNNRAKWGFCPTGWAASPCCS